MTYLIDSDWIIDALADRAEARETLDRLAPAGLAVSVVSLGEIYEGAFTSSNPSSTLSSFRDFLSPYPVIGLDDPIMEDFAQTRARLRALGQVIPDFDLLIAATALHRDFDLLSRNLKHFRRVPELRVLSSP